MHADERRTIYTPAAFRAKQELTRRQVELTASYLRNLFVKVPKHAKPGVAIPARTMFGKVVGSLFDKLPAAADNLDQTGKELLAFKGFRVRPGSRSAGAIEQEIRRRTGMVGSSRTGLRSSAWSALCWPSQTYKPAGGIALAESAIGLFKTEVVKLHDPFEPLVVVEYALMEWSDWYNNVRLRYRFG